MGTSLRTSNLLGATSLALSELLLTGATAAARTSRSGAAALVVLSGAPGLSVTELGRRTGLSQPAATRMVESLERQGLVRREPSWANWVGVHLTGLGQQAAQELLGSRQRVLTDALGTLDDHERRQLDGLLAKLLARLCREPGDAERLCRLCDRVACVAQEAVCPVGEAERRRRARAGENAGPPGTAGPGRQRPRPGRRAEGAAGRAG